MLVAVSNMARLPGFAAENSLGSMITFYHSRLVKVDDKKIEVASLPGGCGPGVCDGQHCPGEVWTNTYCAGFVVGVQFCQNCQCNYSPPNVSCGSWYPCGGCVGFPW